MITEYDVVVHEAGHAVMDFLWRVPVKSVTIVPDPDKNYLLLRHRKDEKV